MNRDEQAQQQERQRFQERRQDFAMVFQGPKGETVIRHLSERFEASLPAFRDPELADCDPMAAAIKAAIRDGQREVIQYIKDMSR